MKKLLLFLALLPVFGTDVTDTIRDGAGNPVSGTMFITPGSQFTGVTGQQVYQVPIVVAIGSDGIFSVTLIPNDTATPSGTSYTVNYTLDGPPGFTGQTPTETWVVPTSGSPVGLATVRTSPAPTPGYTITFSQIATGTNTTATLTVGSGAIWSALSATRTAPFKAGTVASLPATCTVGDTYFATNATAGQNLYFCTTTNIWTQQSGGTAAFSGLTGGTNTTAAMVVGSGASMAVTGSGTIAATTAAALASNPTDCSSNQFANAIAASGNLTCAAPLTLTTTGSSGAATFTGGTLNIPQYTGGGGSVFTGSTASAPSFSATPTFSLADVSVKSPVRFEPGAMTANVTSVTFTNKTAGAKFSIAWLQDGTGGRTVSYGASASNTCTVSTTASKTTTQQFEVKADGTTVVGVGCSTDDTGNVVVTDGTNTGTAAFTLNASASTNDEAIRVPNVAGAANTSDGAISYDTTNKNLHTGTNGADGILPIVASVPTNGNCPKWVVASSKVSLSNDTCSSGSSMFSTAGTGNTWVFGPPQYVASAALVGAVNRVVYFEFSTGDTFTFTKFLGYQGTDVSGKHYAYAIYDSSCTLLQGGSTVTSSGYSPHTSTATAVTVTPGTYFLALTADDTGMGYYTNNGGTVQALVLNQESTKRVFYGANASTGTSTLTFPGTCGARTSLTADVPVIALVP